jgi:hypothetical protein
MPQPKQAVANFARPDVLFPLIRSRRRRISLASPAQPTGDCLSKTTLKHTFPCEKQVVSNLVQWETFLDFLPIASSVDHLAQYLFFSGPFINPESLEKKTHFKSAMFGKYYSYGLVCNPSI